MIRLRLVFVMLLVVIGLVPVPAVAKGPDFAHSVAASLFLREQGSNRTLLQLDGMTLGNLSAITLSHLGLYPAEPSAVIGSPDGAIIGVVTIARTPVEASSYTIRLFNRAGLVVRHFHPAVPLTVTYVANDASRVAGLELGKDGKGTRGWVMVNTRTGRVVSRLAEATWPILYDPATNDVYDISGTHSLVITAHSLAGGSVVGQLTLPDMVPAWTGPALIHNLPVLYQAYPAIALSHDGTSLALYSGIQNRLTLIDVPRLRVTATLNVRRPQSGLEQLGERLGLLPTAAEAKGVALGMILRAHFSLDGHSLYVTGERYDLGAQQQQVVTHLGVERIDLATGQIEATALAGMPVWWRAQAADGSSLYALTPVPRSDGDYSYEDGHYLLQRLDPLTLHVTAQRQLDAPTQPQLYVFGGWQSGW